MSNRRRGSPDGGRSIAHRMNTNPATSGFKRNSEKNAEPKSRPGVSPGQQRPSAREEPVTFADPSPQARWAKRDAWSLNIFFPFRGARQRSYRRFGGRNAAAPEERLAYVFNSMVGTARCAVPARVVAGGTNNRPALAFEGVAPLHAARTSQRDVPTTLNTYWLPAALGRRDACPTVSAAPSVLLRLRYFIVTVACGL